jgi:alanyl-tRNA synthetase
MGFERVTAVLQGKRSNYDTDVFTPIIETIANLTGRPYAAEADQVAMRVIADHIRMLTFSIADGAIPGNEGRGYVLRRILRRAARFGRNLGMRDPFIYRAAETVVRTMGHVFPEIVEKREHVEKVIRAEEESFNATLDRGLEIFSTVAGRKGSGTVFPGNDAFRLYDTYGFPLDLTQLMAAERGLTVDEAEFTARMEEQRSRARAAGKGETLQAATGIVTRLGELQDSTFVGYRTLEAETVLQDVLDGRYLALSETPFYVASGGQVDDTGVIEADGFRGDVLRSFRQDRKILHEVRVQTGDTSRLRGARVRARVDGTRRHQIMRNHSATHLVHEALRRVLGTHVHQQGSLVAPDRLRFDFPHFGKITPEELRAIEEMVNGKIREALPVITEEDVAIARARTIPNVKMFFGDKYGDIVRVVFMDPAYSVEFCGGTHVANTREIGLFKIVAETGIASGVRRIEAVTGDGVRRYIDEQLARVREADDRLALLLEETASLERELHRHGDAPPPAPRPALGAVSLPADDGTALRVVEAALAGREEAIDAETHRTHELKKRVSRYSVQDAAAGLDALVGNAVTVAGVRVAASRVNAGSLDELKSVGDALRSRLGSGVGVLGAVIDEKVALVCVVTDDLVAARRLQAGKIVGDLARRVGGGGGGRPHMATAGGKDVDKLDETLREAPSVVQKFFSA